MNDESEALKKYLIKYIQKARSFDREFGSFDIFGCYSPCQISVIWFQNPCLQLIFFKHLSGEDDLSIQINGPYPSCEAFQILPNYFKESGYIQSYLKFISPKYLEKIEEAFETESIAIIRNIQRLIERGEQKSAIHRSTIMFPFLSIWVIEGHLPTLALNDLVDQLGIKTEQSKEVEIDRTDGWAAYYYPPITFDEINNSFSEKLSPQSVRTITQEECTGYIDNYPIFIGKDGMIGVLGTNQIRCLEIINLFFAFSLIRGINCLPARPEDLYKFSFNWDEHIIDIIRNPAPIFSARYTSIKEHKEVAFYPQLKREKIELELIQNIFYDINAIIDKPKVIRALHFLQMAYHQLYEYEYNSAFTLTWTIIENWVLDEWSSFIQSKQMSKNSQKRLERFNIDTILISTYFADIIPKKQYDQIDSLRKKRNKIIHEGQYASKKDVENNINLALDLMKTYLPRQEAFLPKKNKQENKNKPPIYMKIELQKDS